MIGDIVGYCKVKPSITKTHYFYGPNSDLENQTLKVMEQARDGSCLCLNPASTGLVDVHFEDIDNFKLNPAPNNPLELLSKIIRNLNEKRNQPKGQS